MENSRRKEKDLMLTENVDRKGCCKRMENSKRKEKDLIQKRSKRMEIKEKRERSNVDRKGVREWRTQREKRKI